MRNIRYIKPRIKIGDCKEGHKTVLEDDVVTIWLDTIYYDDSYIYNFVSPITWSKITNYQYEVTCDEVGWHTIKMEIIDKETATVLTSNSLLLIVL